MERILRIFDRHAKTMEQRAQERFDAVKLESLVDSRTVRKKSSEDELLGKRLPRDEFAGDVNFRTLQALLKKIDDRGYERVRSLASVPHPLFPPHLQLTDPPTPRHSLHINFVFTIIFSKQLHASCIAMSGVCSSRKLCKSMDGDLVLQRS